MKRYINFKYDSSTPKETVDQIDSENFADLKAFRKECERLLSEYVLAFNSNNLWLSRRPCANWSK